MTPPDSVELKETKLRSGRAVEGRYCKTSQERNGRPVYHASAGLGHLYLAYEPQHRRWAITDMKSWEAFEDRCWAFCSSDAMHPGELRGEAWLVWGGMENGAATYKVAPHLT